MQGTIIQLFKRKTRDAETDNVVVKVGRMIQRKFGPRGWRHKQVAAAGPSAGSPGDDVISRPTAYPFIWGKKKYEQLKKKLNIVHLHLRNQVELKSL